MDEGMPRDALLRDIDPDYDMGSRTEFTRTLQAGSIAARGRAVGVPIGAWAWGLSRALDYLQSDAAVDANESLC